MPYPTKTSNQNSNWQTKILARTVRWDWCGIFQIHILDENEQPYLVLNERQTFVFHEADGNNTIEDIINCYINSYIQANEVPEICKNELLKAAKELIFEHNIIEFWTQKDTLPSLLNISKTDYEEWYSTPSLSKRIKGFFKDVWDFTKYHLSK